MDIYNRVLKVICDQMQLQEDEISLYRTFTYGEMVEIGKGLKREFGLIFNPDYIEWYASRCTFGDLVEYVRSKLEDK